MQTTTMRAHGLSDRQAVWVAEGGRARDLGVLPALSSSWVVANVATSPVLL